MFAFWTKMLHEFYLVSDGNTWWRYPSPSCFLHSSNCIPCQQKWNRWVDMAFTDSTNFVSNCLRGLLYLILSMTHFFLVLFSPLSKSMYYHWWHVTCLLQSTSGFCLELILAMYLLHHIFAISKDAVTIVISNNFTISCVIFIPF